MIAPVLLEEWEAPDPVFEPELDCVGLRTLVNTVWVTVPPSVYCWVIVVVLESLVGVDVVSLVWLGVLLVIVVHDVVNNVEMAEVVVPVCVVVTGTEMVVTVAAVETLVENRFLLSK